MSLIIITIKIHTFDVQCNPYVPRIDCIVVRWMLSPDLDNYMYNSIMSSNCTCQQFLWAIVHCRLSPEALTISHFILVQRCTCTLRRYMYALAMHQGSPSLARNFYFHTRGEPGVRLCVKNFLQGEPGVRLCVGKFSQGESLVCWKFIRGESLVWGYVLKFQTRLGVSYVHVHVGTCTTLWVGGVACRSLSWSVHTVYYANVHNSFFNFVIIPLLHACE